MVEAVKFLTFSPCLKWFLIVGMCHQPERLNAGNTYLLKCDMAGSNEIASCVTVWLQIENNRMIIVNNGDDVTIYFTWGFILLTWEFASDT